MTRIFPGASSLLGSIAGRTIVILAFGLTLAVAASLLIAEQVRLRDLDQLRRAGLVASVVTTIANLRDHPAETERAIAAGRIVGIHIGRVSAGSGTRDKEAERLLVARMGSPTKPRIVRFPAADCERVRDPASNSADPPPMSCWVIAFTVAGGKRQVLTADLPLIHVYQSAFLDPVYLLLLAGIRLGLAVLVTRSTVAPLQRLTRAARQFSIATEPVDIPEQGPREVRTALRTFNLMQQRVRDGVRERTHILAAVSHDLQTPLTRMRLRVEKVVDGELRKSLIDDLAVMQRLVGEGLDLARSTEQHEPWSVVDIDSVLSSLADDMADLGATVILTERANVRAQVRLTALVRSIQNLVDNAVKYGGSAELGTSIESDVITVTVRDHGPGIPDADLPAAFEPFTRLASGRADGRGGTGLGLTIARAQAATFGALVALRNHADGGILATITIPVGADT